MHDVLLANLVAMELLWEAVSSAGPEKATERVQIQDAFIDASIELLQQAVTGLAAGYLEVEQGRVADEEHDMQTLVEMLAGARPTDRRIEERAERRGVDLKGIRWCAVVKPPEDKVGDQVRALRRASKGGAIGRIGRRLVAFLPGEAIPTLGSAQAGVAAAEDPSSGYRRAAAALQVAEHLNRPLVRYEEVVPLAMVLSGPEEDRRAFVDAQLGPLLEDPLGAELVKTLDAYYRAGQSIAAAARDLYVHRHTLEYRLSRIEAALGADFRSPENRLLLELALALRTDHH